MEKYSLLLEPLYTLIPEVLIIIFCFRYYLKTKSSNALYLTIASILLWISHLGSSFSFFLMVDFDMDPLMAGVIGGIVNLIGLSSAFLFAFGLRNFFRKNLGLIIQTKKETIDQIGKS